MPEKSIKVLIVDDEPQLLEISKAFLENLNGFEVETSLSAKDATKKMRKTAFDAIVSDYQMPETDGIEFLKSIRLCNDPIPFILFTGKGREDVAIEALNSGADFYLQKGGDPKAQFAELENMIKQAFARKMGDRMLRASEMRLRTYLDNAPEGIFIVDASGNYQDINKTACSMLEYSREELLRLNFRDITKKSVAQEALNGFEQLKKKSAISMETTLVRKDGVDIPIFLSGVELPNQRYMAFCADITLRKCAEEGLQRVEESKRSYEERLNIVMDNMTDAVWFTDMQFKLVWMSNSIFRDGGFTIEELNEIPIENQMSPDSYNIIISAMATLLTPENILDVNKEIGFTGELEYYRKDGSTIWYEMISRLLRDELGKPIGILMVGRDITKRKLVESQLGKTEEKYRQLVETSSDGIFTIDLKGNINWANEYGRNMLGYSEADLPIALRKLIPIRYWSEALRLFNNGLKGKVVTEPFELDVLTKDGRRFPVSYKGTLLHDEKGNVIGVMGVIRELRDSFKLEGEREVSHEAGLGQV